MSITSRMEYCGDAEIADAGGSEPRLTVDIVVYRLREMDELVLVSDGVSVMVEK